MPQRTQSRRGVDTTHQHSLFHMLTLSTVHLSICNRDLVVTTISSRGSRQESVHIGWRGPVTSFSGNFNVIPKAPVRRDHPGQKRRTVQVATIAAIARAAMFAHVQGVTSARGTPDDDAVTQRLLDSSSTCEWHYDSTGSNSSWDGVSGDVRSRRDIRNVNQWSGDPCTASFGRE